MRRTRRLKAFERRTRQRGDLRRDGMLPRVASRRRRGGCGIGSHHERQSTNRASAASTTTAATASLTLATFSSFAFALALLPTSGGARLDVDPIVGYLNGAKNATRANLPRSCLRRL